MTKVENSDSKNQRLIDITVEDLQNLIEQTVKSCLDQSLSQQEQEQPDKLLSVEQAAELLSLHRTTIYGLTSKGELPFMKRSKRLYFSEKELMEYLRQGRKNSLKELGEQASNYLLKHNKKGGIHA